MSEENRPRPPGAPTRRARRLAGASGRSRFAASRADLSHPIVLLVFVIVLSVIALIGAAVLGIDRGVSSNMSRSDFARGIITYLFAVVTIGTAVVLVLSALVGTGDEVDEQRFQRGKEILALLLGVFGTIVGFYFAADVGGSRAEAGVLRLSTLDVSPRIVEAGGTIAVRAVVTGGMLPYRFGTGLGDDTVDVTDTVAEGGWIVKDVPVRQLRPQEAQVVHVIVQDAGGRRVEQTATITIGPPR